MIRFWMPMPRINKIPRTKTGFKKKANGKRADAEPKPAYFSSNMRLGIQAKNRLTNVWRESGLDIAKQHSLPRHGRGKFFCLVTVRHPMNVTYDAMNWYPAAKAMIDGIIGDYGFLPDDSNEHLVGPLCVKGDQLKDKFGGVWVQFFDMSDPSDVHLMNQALRQA